MSPAGGGGGSPGYPPPSSLLEDFSGLGLGYAVGIGLGSLVLLSTILLATYICCRAAASDARDRAAAPAPLPRIIFVAEDEEEEGGRSPVQGLDPAVMNSYPKFPFSKAPPWKAAAAAAEAVCAICLCKYREGEMLRVLPDCRHGFHLGCVDAWLRLNASCPVCRTSPTPTPLSTPLAELVPLSHYAAANSRRR